MHKTLYLFLAILALSLSGCSGAAPKDQIIGTWKSEMDTSSLSGNEKALADQFATALSMTVEIKADGKATMTAGQQTMNGTWTLEGQKFTMKSEKATAGSNGLSGTLSGDGKTIEIDMGSDTKGPKFLLKKQ